jgi:NMD protein affecting ribosome stability and mRNA decay
MKIVVFKNKSKTTGKVYYSIQITQFINDHLITTNSFLFEKEALEIINEKGVTYVDLTNKK